MSATIIHRWVGSSFKDEWDNHSSAAVHSSLLEKHFAKFGFSAVVSPVSVTDGAKSDDFDL